MQDIFYSHLLPIDDVTAMLDEYELSDEERQELLDLIYQMFDHRAIEVIFLHLPPEHHEEVVRMMSLAPQDLEIMVFIKQHAPDIEAHLQDAGAELAMELRGLLHKPKRGTINSKE